MTKRIQAEYLEKIKRKFPVVCVTGVRQCGKTTMLRDCLPDYRYVSLEDPDVREYALSDPRGFLRHHEGPCILDEVQRAPELFSYIQTLTDNNKRMGEYILSGSHNFLLMENLSQSLAGRAAILKLAPFSIRELRADGHMDDCFKLMRNGGYPAIYDRDISPEDYFPSYIQTYIERDVRLIRNIPDTGAFIRFIRLLAARSGQIISYTELSSAAGISVPTVRAWLSVLEQSYIIFFLSPFYNNYSKRLVKSPKLYFYDTGLLCYLLGILSDEKIAESDHRGAVFETLVVSEYVKSQLFLGREPSGYFWRDTNQNEVDLLTADADRLKAYEIKLGDTMEKKYLKGLKKFSDTSGISLKDCTCIYTGDEDIKSDFGCFSRYDRVFDS